MKAMTAADWAAAMRGEPEDIAAYADWLEEEGYGEESALSRDLPHAVRFLRKEWGDTSWRFVFARMTPSGADARSGFAVVWQDVLPPPGSFLWVAAPALSLAVHGRYYGYKSPGYPLAAWLEAAARLHFLALRTDAECGVVAKYKRKEG